MNQWEAKDPTTPSSDNLLRLSEVLRVRTEWLLDERGEMLDGEIAEEGSQALQQNVRPAPDAPSLATGRYPVDIEVRGVAVGGKDGEFMFNGETIDRVRRPPGIANLSRVNAIYVAGSSMDPWRKEGSLAYFTDLRPARAGDHVIVELHPTRKYENGVALLKRFVSRSGSRIRLAQYNPPDDNIVIDAAKVRHIYKVFEWEELLGV